jgi:hypothetical protein
MYRDKEGQTRAPATRAGAEWGPVSLRVPGSTDTGLVRPPSAVSIVTTPARRAAGRLPLVYVRAGWTPREYLHEDSAGHRLPVGPSTQPRLTRAVGVNIAISPEWLAKSSGKIGPGCLLCAPGGANRERRMHPPRRVRGGLISPLSSLHGSWSSAFATGWSEPRLAPRGEPP